MTLYLYMHTMGCQMNVYDSGQIRNRLAPMGYTLTEDPSRADLIILNTCSIREKAEQKAFSFLGRLAPLKQENPELIIAIGGCVAQQEGERILGRMPFIDLIFGTQAIARLPQHIARIRRGRCRLVDVRMSEVIEPEDYLSGPLPQSDVSAFVTIMRGCDNYCTYCVVPYVRGRETSRPPEDIVREIRHLVEGGVREVTLLGQNVNSYGLKEGLCTFAELLARVDDIEGLARIRFTTSHPKDLSMELMQAFGRLEKLCRHIHLPVQSGSDAVLKRMNRRYTRADYLEKVARLRAICPEIAITSDIITGFPGETDGDFDATCDLIQQVGFDGLFAFVYSDRPNAPAVRFDRKVTEAVKKARLNTVLEQQAAATLSKHQSLVGTVQRILVDGPGKPQDLQAPEDRRWSGRTSANKIVHFSYGGPMYSESQWLTGRLMDIMIEKALPHCLSGRLTQEPAHVEVNEKGDHGYAA
jgi:tRNA-2-methylthio-N6-dimethylallyladenosine synthase